MSETKKVTALKFKNSGKTQKNNLSHPKKIEKEVEPEPEKIEDTQKDMPENH